MNYKKILQRAQKEKSNVHNIIDELVDDYDFNSIIKKRWLSGKDVNGGLIGKYSSKSYANKKKNQNPLADGNVDLILSGEMIRELEVFEIGRLKYAFGSGVDYFEKISTQYGLDNFNITAEEQLELFDFVLLRAQEKYIQNVWLV